MLTRLGSGDHRTVLNEGAKKEGARFTLVNYYPFFPPLVMANGNNSRRSINLQSCGKHARFARWSAGFDSLAGGDSLRSFFLSFFLVAKVRGPSLCLLISDTCLMFSAPLAAKHN